MIALGAILDAEFWKGSPDAVCCRRRSVDRSKSKKKNSKIEQKSKKPTVLVNLPENIDLMYT